MGAGWAEIERVKIKAKTQPAGGFSVNRGTRTCWQQLNRKQVTNSVISCHGHAFISGANGIDTRPDSSFISTCHQPRTELLTGRRRLQLEQPVMRNP